MIRKAEIADASRIAEIAIFAKRVAYRSIFKDDKTSFGEMQVVPLAEKIVRQQAEGLYVLDEDFVRGYMAAFSEGDMFELAELYVDPLLQGEGTGGRLISHCLELAREGGYKRCELWVLEENRKAVGFYKHFGFSPTGERAEEAPGVYKIRMKIDL